MQWAVVGFPCPVHAADAGMDLDEYADLVYAAAFCDRDGAEERWDRQGAAQGRLVERLDGRPRAAHRRAGHRPHAAGRRAARGRARPAATNLPDGEVFTGPHRGLRRGRRHVPVPGAPRRAAASTASGSCSSAAWWSRRTPTTGRTCSTRRSPSTPARAAWARSASAPTTRCRGSPGARCSTRRSAAPSTSRSARATRRPAARTSRRLHWDLVCDLRGGGELLLDGEPIQRDGPFVPELALGCDGPASAATCSSTGARTLVMGIVNNTPDSFYDGGRHYGRGGGGRARTRAARRGRRRARRRRPDRPGGRRDRGRGRDRARRRP